MLKKIIFIFASLFIAVSVFANTQKDTFNRTVKYLDHGGLSFQYQNLENLDEQINFLLNFANEAADTGDPMQQMAIKNFIEVLKMMNFSYLRAIGSSTMRLNNNLYANKLFVNINPNSTGLLKSLDIADNVKMKYARTLPADTIFAAGAYWDFAKTYAAIEQEFKNQKSFNDGIILLEQMFGVKPKDLAQSLTGEFFCAIYNGSRRNEKHFIAILPDSKDVLKTLATRYFGPSLRRYNDGSFSWEMPVSATDFGSAITVYFAKKSVIVYNSNAPLKALLNNGNQARKLAAANPAVFGCLENLNGTSYMILNFNPSDIYPDAPNRKYCFSSVVKYMPNDGYLIDGRSDFNVQNMKEYAPLLEIFPEFQKHFNKNKPLPPPVSL